jgi:hypothetical protein
VDIEMGPDGNLYYLAIDLGQLRRIRHGAPAPPPPPPSSSGYLSDRAWSSMTNGYGPVEKDRSNGQRAAGDGRTITLNGTTYAKGLGAHAPSNVRYNLGGACTTFTAEVGVDDEVGSRGSVVFQVWADGRKLYDSGVMRGNTATKSVNVSVAGKKELKLIVTATGDGKADDHADWANARVTCGS